MKLIDFMITTHPAYGRLKELASEQKKNIHQGRLFLSSDRFRSLICSIVLNDKLEELQKEEGVSSRTELTKDMHFYPDLHGASLSNGFNPLE